MQQVEVNSVVRVLFDKIGHGVVKQSKVLAIKPGNVAGDILVKTEDGTIMATVVPLNDKSKADFKSESVCLLGSNSYQPEGAAKALGFKNIKLK